MLGGVRSAELSIVSLFTREWIEINRLDKLKKEVKVSLFTREWIEIVLESFALQLAASSPSLRGSGLKLRKEVMVDVGKRLPLYEGVD